MFVCNLITDPTAPRLGISLVESLRSAWGGGHVQWLAPNEAAEFQVSTMPENFWDVWAEFQILYDLHPAIKYYMTKLEASVPKNEALAAKLSTKLPENNIWYSYCGYRSV